mgnify:CR=1 FL=1
MKRKCLNRILSILLVAAMVLSLGPTVLAAQEPVSYTHLTLPTP